MPLQDMVDAIGRTPLVKLQLPGPAAVYAKLELANPFGMKDRAARHMVLEARRSGRLAPGAPIIESSSGTMALGLALVGRRLGHEVHIVTDPRIDPVTLAKLEALGCAVHVVAAMTTGGWQSARLELLAELVRDLPGAFCPRQYSNPDNAAAYGGLAAELLAELDRVDVLLGAVGSGGSLCGTTRALRNAGQRVRVVGVDSVGSMLFGQPDRPGRLQSGLGNSLLPPNLDHAVIDEVHWLNDREAFGGTDDLAAEQQIFGGNTSGSVYRVARELARRAADGASIVAILPDRGDRYVQSVYSAKYRAEHDLDRLEDADTPRRVDYGEPVTGWSYAWLRAPDQPDQLAVIESNTTGTGMSALRAAREMGLHPVLYTADPTRYPQLAETGAEAATCDTGDLGLLAERIGPACAGITTTSDFYTQTAALLAAKLGLPGNDPEAVARCRDKAATRLALDEAGVRQPRYAVVGSAAQAADAAQELGPLCVVKPTDDSGSNRVLLCRDPAQAAEQVGRILAVATNVRGQPASRRVLVEQYVPGAEFSVESFSLDGHHHVVGVTSRHLSAPPVFVELGHAFPAELDPAVEERIRDAAVSALRAVGYLSGPAHTELRVAADGAVHVIEINPRLAGGMIPELVRLARGIDLLRQQLNACVGRPGHLEPSAGRHAGIRFLTAEAEGVLAAARGLEAARRVPGVSAVELTAPVGGPVRPPTSAYERLGFVIAAADTPAEVRAALDEALAQVELVIDARETP